MNTLWKNCEGNRELITIVEDIRELQLSDKERDFLGRANIFLQDDFVKYMDDVIDWLSNDLPSDAYFDANLRNWLTRAYRTRNILSLILQENSLARYKETDIQVPSQKIFEILNLMQEITTEIDAFMQSKNLIVYAPSPGDFFDEEVMDQHQDANNVASVHGLTQVVHDMYSGDAALDPVQAQNVPNWRNKRLRIADCLRVGMLNADREMLRKAAVVGARGALW